MSKRITHGAIAALIIIQVITLSKVSALQQELQQTRNQLMSDSSMLRNEISGIYRNVEEHLEQQASLLDSYEHQLGELNKESLSVPVDFSVSPKEFKADEMAVLYVGDREVSMRQVEGAFLATVELGLFESLEARVIFDEAGVRRSETLDLSRRELWTRYLPSLYAYYPWRGDWEEGEYIMDDSIHLDGYLESEAGVRIESVELVVTLDGEVIDRIAPQEIDMEYETEHVQEVSERMESRFQEFVLKDSYPLKAGQTLQFTVVSYDSLGLIYNTVAHTVEGDSSRDSVLILEEFVDKGWGIIADSEGNILNGPEDYQLVR